MDGGQLLKKRGLLDLGGFFLHFEFRGNLLFFFLVDGLMLHVLRHWRQLVKLIKIIIVNTNSITSGRKSIHKGRVADTTGSLCALHQLQSAHHQSHVPVPEESVRVKINEAHQVFNAEVALVVEVKVCHLEVLVLEGAGGGTF